MSLMLCVMMIINPVRSLMALEATFKPYDALLGGDRTLFHSKCLFAAVNLGALAVVRRELC